MEYQVQVRHVPSQTTAVVRFRAAPNELSAAVPRACGEVWSFARAAGLPRPGRHLAVYLDGEINVEVGAEMDQPFVGDGRVVCSNTPAGLVATTVHWGPYHRLGDAHKAVVQWCAANGQTPAGVNWEIYGHWEDAWNDDPAKIRTDVFYLLRDADQGA
jgi:effector-binding domain-containing protein